MDIKNVQSSLLNNRINDNQKSLDKANNAPQTGKSEQNVAQPGGDRVTLTSFSTQMLDMEKRAPDADSSNEARIAELKRAIQDGDYEVNTSRVAEKFLNMERLMAQA